MRAHRAKPNPNGRLGKSAPRMIPVPHSVDATGNNLSVSPTESYLIKGGVKTKKSQKKTKTSPRHAAGTTMLGHGLHTGANHNHHASPHQLGETKNRPIWVNDYAAPNCHRCKAPFTFFFRRHHCRGCGQVYCSGCTNQHCSLPHMGYDSPVRVCLECFKNRETLGTKQKRQRTPSGNKISRKHSDTSGSSDEVHEQALVKRKKDSNQQQQQHQSKGALAFSLADAIARGDVDLLAQLVIDARINFGPAFDLNTLRVGMCEGEGAEAEVEEVTLLDVAARSLTPACQKILEILIVEQGMDPTQPVNSRGDTPLLVAASAGNLVALQYFLHRIQESHSESELHRTNSRGETALHVACTMLVRRIYPGHEGSLEGAAAEDIITALLESGLHVEAKDSLGRTPLHSAVAHNVWHEGELIDPGVVRHLLEAGADINAVDYKGRSALHLAAALSNQVIVQCLLKDPRVRVNLQDAQGNTPLHLAVLSPSSIAGLGTSPGMSDLSDEGTTATIAYLLAAHADTSIRNAAGKTALDVAATDYWRHMINSAPQVRLQDSDGSSFASSTSTTTTTTTTVPSSNYVATGASDGDGGGGVPPPSSTSSHDTSSMVY